MTYWSAADLQALLGTQVVLECFDDQRVGVINPALLSQVQALADNLVDGALGRVYPGPFPIVQTFPTWAASLGYGSSAMVQPSAAAGYAFRVIGAGGTSGVSEPTWPAQLGLTVQDNGITWLCVSTTPELIRYASLLWGKALAYERHSEYVKRYGARARKEAETNLDRLVAARSYLTDALNLTKPDNVGGVVYARGPRMTIDSVTGESNSGDF